MKLSIYNRIVEVEDGFVIYNTHVSKYYKINKEKDVKEFRALLNKKTFSEKTLLVEDLFNKDFIVGERKNEYESVRKKINKFYKNMDKQLRMLIYTTNQCNFRCIYCPEKHENVKLTQENWDSLYRYIEKNVKNKKYEVITLGFFGGEPLLEARAIIDFLKKVSKLKKYNKNLSIEHTITTNGYLLTPKIYDELVKYDLKLFQITIDGFASSHDVTRPRVDGVGTWDKIIENLEYIDKQNDGARFSIRVNVSKFNQESVIKFFNWFDEKFKNQKFNYDIVPVSKFSDKVDDKYVIERTSVVIDNLSDCLYKFRKFGNYASNPVSRLSHTCKCAQSNFYTLAANGKVYKCEKTYAEAEPVGHLEKNGNIVFTEDIKPWTKNFEYEECKTCYLYPICAGRSCPSKKVISKSGERFDCECEKEYANHQIEEIIKSGNYDPEDVYEHDEEKQKLQKKNKKRIYRRKLKYSGDNVDELAINDFIELNKDFLTKSSIAKIRKAFEEYKKDSKIETLFNALGDKLADKFKIHFYSIQAEKKDLSVLFKIPLAYERIKDKNKIDKCLKIFDKTFAKYEYRQDKLRLTLLKKIRKLISDGKL